MIGGVFVTSRNNEASPPEGGEAGDRTNWVSGVDR